MPTEPNELHVADGDEVPPSEEDVEQDERDPEGDE